MKYYIDGRKVADEPLVETWRDLCAGINPSFPNMTSKIVSGQYMVGDLTNINIFSALLTDSDMKEVISFQVRN